MHAALKCNELYIILTLLWKNEIKNDNKKWKCIINNKGRGLRYKNRNYGIGRGLKIRCPGTERKK